jgi:hypothetical protein
MSDTPKKDDQKKADWKPNPKVTMEVQRETAWIPNKQVMHKVRLKKAKIRKGK